MWKKLAAWYDVQKHRARARQAFAVLVSIYGILTAAVPSMHLHPEWVAGVITAFGPVVISIEHYVDDPSTGGAVNVVTDTEAAIKKVETPPVVK